MLKINPYISFRSHTNLRKKTPQLLSHRYQIENPSEQSKYSSTITHRENGYENISMRTSVIQFSVKKRQNEKKKPSI